MQNPHALIRKLATASLTMNLQKVLQKKKNRKAISPVLATVILIAITLIAAIAIAGFVFGLFGNFLASARVSVTSVSCTEAAPGGSSTITCLYTLTNNGNANTALSGSASLTYSDITLGSQTLSITGVNCDGGGSLSAGATCTITTTAVFTEGAGSGGVTGGTAFTGQIGLTNGGSAQYSGTF
jgi:archaeal type IV pilus assembly protein PilA